MSELTNMHFTGLVYAGYGVLFRGVSGAGKSLLALEMLEVANWAGQKAALVADDRLDLFVEKGKLMMQAPPEIAGLIELRGRGIVQRRHVKRAEVHLLVDLVETYERLVEEDELKVELLGVQIARCPVPVRKLVDSAQQRLLVNEALRALTKNSSEH